MSSSISWHAYEYHHTPKTSDWYWALGIISVSLAGAALIYGNGILAILIVVAAISLGIHAHRIPRLVDFELNEKGARIEHTFYPYASLESFAVEAHEHDIHDIVSAKVLLKSKKTFMPFIVLPMAEVSIEEVREYLSIFLKEEEHRESTEEKLLEYLGF